jgi:histidinol dehydrogenase
MIQLFRMKDKDTNRFQQIFKRSQIELSEVKETVRGIIQSVQDEGDWALVRYAQQFDDVRFTKSGLKVDAEAMKEAYENILPKVLASIKDQIKYSRAFHQTQLGFIRDWEKNVGEGIIAGEKWTPIEAVGLYVPGGKNPFPTVAQILAVPASLAGCPRIVACISPKGKQQETLVALAECGVTEIYRASGAQAIAAMALNRLSQ